MQEESATNGKLPVEIGFSAKARLEARVSTEIPPQSSGRLLDALTDIIRPFSERRGLKADQIRLQREEVLIEIAHRAQQRLALENQSPSPIPNKFLVPFLEKASLEVEDDSLVDRWADLLAACASEPKSAHPRYVQILSEMTSEDAKILRQVAFNCIDVVSAPKAALVDCDRFEPGHVEQDIVNWLRTQMTTKHVRAFVNRIYDYAGTLLASPGVAVIDIAVEVGEKFWSFKLDRLPEQNLAKVLSKASRSLDILYSLYLLKFNKAEITDDRCYVAIWYVTMTALGVEFLMKCDHELREKLRSSPRIPVSIRD